MNRRPLDYLPMQPDYPRRELSCRIEQSLWSLQRPSLALRVFRLKPWREAEHALVVPA